MSEIKSQGGQAQTNKSNHQGQNTNVFNKSEKTQSIRQLNIQAAKAVADVIRTSLGPRGMDKMIKDGRGEVIITNDGATILKQMDVVHPTAKMLVEISKAQDIEAGDGTTSVVVIAGALLNACQLLLDRGIHPTSISEGFGLALNESVQILDEISEKIDLNNKDKLITCVNTALSSKVVSSNSKELSPIAVDAVLKIFEPNLSDPKLDNVDLRDIKIVKKLGGTIEDTTMVDGLVFAKNKPSQSAGGPTRMEKASIALIQFCLSSPKTDVENNIVITDYHKMEKIMKEERIYIAGLVNKIAQSGAKVVLIQKSILRDATNDLSLHFLAKKGIMVIKDVEREDVEFISKTIGALPCAHVDYLTSDKLGYAELVEEEKLSDDSRLLKITGPRRVSKTVSILCHGSNQLVLDEAERSLHDALCVVRSLVKSKGLVCGGGAPEIEIACRLTDLSRKSEGINSIIFRAFADALEVIPYTLAENAGLNPIEIVTQLRKRHNDGQKNAGISVKRGTVVDDISKEQVLQPILVTRNALTLATECVRMILKIDDVIISAR